MKASKSANASYAKDGVDIAVGDNFSTFAAEVCRSTWKSSRFVRVKDFAAHNFRGPRGYKLRNLPSGFYCDVPADGVGTKVGIINEALAHRTAGRDIFAMSGSDITRYGGIPLVMSNVLDVSTLGKPGSETYMRMGELIVGLGEACREQGVVLMRGETAELGPFVGSENLNALTKFNWSGFMQGAYHPKRIIDGRKIRPGDIVHALKEKGFRSNGLSSVRRAFAAKFGRRWWQNEEAQPAIHAAAEPSVLYDRFFAKVNGWYSRKFEPLVELKAIVHISGGGIVDKFGKDILFPRGLSTYLDDLWEPPTIMQECLEWHPEMTEYEAYKGWNGGQGMLAISDPSEACRFEELADKEGIQVIRAGVIHNDKGGPRLEIVSKYTSDGRNVLTYFPDKR